MFSWQQNRRYRAVSIGVVITGVFTISLGTGASLAQQPNPLVKAQPHVEQQVVLPAQAKTSAPAPSSTHVSNPNRRTITASTTLHLFGYSFFAPARAYVSAQYRALVSPSRQFESTMGGPYGQGSAQINPILPGMPNGLQQGSRPVPGSNVAIPPPPGYVPAVGAAAAGAATTGVVVPPMTGSSTSITPGPSAQGNSAAATNFARPVGVPVAGAGQPQYPYNGVNPYGGEYPGGYPPPDQYGMYPYGNPNLQSQFTQSPPSQSAFSGIITPYQQIAFNVAATTPASYRLTGGDQLTIRYSNPAMEAREITAKVDSAGRVQLNSHGAVNVAGLTLTQAEKVIKQRLTQDFKNLSVTVTLRELHSISITVAGQVQVPGTYVVPAVATAFNVLYAAGGPTRDGSLRDIQVRRNGVTLHIDFYSMLAGAAVPHSGNSYAPDINLQPGDVLYVPYAQARVSIEGAVHTPAIYELTPGETIAEAIKVAGGPRTADASSTVEVSTLAPGRAHIIKTLDLEAPQAASTALYDGDIIRILRIKSTIENMVTVTGAVTQPGDYAVTTGMTVADLLRDAREPLPEAYLGRAALYRWGPNGVRTLIPIDLALALKGDPKYDVPVTRWDELKVFSQENARFVGTGKITLEGAVQHPGIYSYDNNTRVSDLLLQAGGPMPDADMVVVEHQHGNGTKTYEYAKISDIEHEGSRSDFLLHDNDIVAVYTNSQTQFIPEHRVTIEGYVVSPGQYDRGTGMRLSDLIKLAGGFAPNAGITVQIAHSREIEHSTDSAIPATTQTVTFNVSHTVVQGNDVALRDGDVVLVDGKSDFEDNPRVVTITGEVAHPGPYFIGENTRLSQVVKMAGGLRADAFAEGAQFHRNPSKIGSPEQTQLANIVNDLDQIYSKSDYERQLALSDLERIRSSDSAVNSTSLIALGGPASSAGLNNPAAAILAEDLAKHSLVTPARQFTQADLLPSGNIAVNLAAAVANPGSSDDILLKDGDRLSVPSEPTTVLILGAVVNPRAVLWKEGARLDYYITNTGGPTPDIDMQHVVVIRANGALAPIAKAGSIRAGDVIFIPSRVLVDKLSNHSNSIQTFMQSLTNGAILFRLVTGSFRL